MSAITVDGESDAELANSVVSAGNDGVVVSTEDDSGMSSTSTSPDYNSSTTTALSDGSSEPSGTVISLSYSTSLNTFDKNIIALVTDLKVTATESFTRAVDNVTLASNTVMSEDAATTGHTSAAGGGMLAANSVQGAVGFDRGGSGHRHDQWRLKRHPGARRRHIDDHCSAAVPSSELCKHGRFGESSARRSRSSDIRSAGL